MLIDESALLLIRGFPALGVVVVSTSIAVAVSADEVTVVDPDGMGPKTGNGLRLWDVPETRCRCD